jgi:hypothetical protein
MYISQVGNNCAKAGEKMAAGKGLSIIATENIGGRREGLGKAGITVHLW